MQNYLGAFKLFFFQYCDNNIGLYSIAPRKVINIPTLQYQNLSLIKSISFIFGLSFVDWFMGLFYISPHIVIVLPNIATVIVVVFLIQSNEKQRADTKK